MPKLLVTYTIQWFSYIEISTKYHYLNGVTSLILIGSFFAVIVDVDVDIDTMHSHVYKTISGLNYSLMT